MATETSPILKLASEGNADELRELWREKCLSSLYVFNKTALGFRHMSAGLHLPLCNFSQEDELRKGCLIPRDHFKSSCITIGKNLWRITKARVAQMKDNRTPTPRILIAGETDTVAIGFVRKMKATIERSQIFQWLFPEIQPGKKWADDAFEIQRDDDYPEPTVKAIGVGGAITGGHFTRITYDDLIAMKAAETPSIMERTKDWYQYSESLLDDPDRDETDMVGTIWFEPDIYSWVMENEPQIAWFVLGCWKDERYEKALNVVLSDEERGQPIFPERFSTETLTRIRDDKLKAYKFSCQFENNPIPKEGSDFPAEWIQYYDISEDGKQIILNKGTPSEERIHVGKLFRVLVGDPSSGGKSATAEFALISAGMDVRKRIFVLEAWARNCPTGDSVEQYLRMIDHWRPHYDGYEAVGAYKDFAVIVRERLRYSNCPVCQKVHRRPKLDPIKPPGTTGERTKEDRIRYLAQTPFQEMRVYLRRGMSKLEKQITRFPFTLPIDLLDTLAYVIWKLRAPLDDEEQQVQREREQAQLVGLGKPYCAGTVYTAST